MVSLHQLSLGLYSTSRLLIQLLQNILKEYNLTYPQYLTMTVLWEEDSLLVKEIGERLHLDSGTLTPLLKKLEAMNYVKRQRGEDDERTVHIELTYPGKSLQTKVEQALRPLEEILNEIPGLELSGLNYSLQNLLESVEKLKNSKKE
ncbi:MarR family winged helix-turn-helix transcriptional regulator [Algoriphagus halophilus]|uniref:DNA-binding transcriptional regulator, MarR family n=1 Tax=Algoriphagus halophilus TaxID=226505 RepID=A0A1N6GBI0_9BACT|nr:MarR family transcriptional regulator [Algoriphagus halophilus]SIO04854.1 DNA-binding transcriptional regulator, MarR family [Algoriphagus halophilus]